MDSNTPIFDPTSAAWQYPVCIQGNHMHIQVASPSTVVMNFPTVPTSMNLQPNFMPPVQVMPMMQQCYGSPMQMMQQQRFAQKHSVPQQLWHVQAPMYCDLGTTVLSEVLPEGLLPIQVPVATVNNSVGNSNQVPTPMSGMQNFQAHAAVATHVDQNVSARFPQRLLVTEMQNLQYHGTTDTSSDTVVLYAVGEVGLQGTYEGEGYFDIAIQSINDDGTYNITYVEYGDVAVLAQGQIRRKQADLSPLEIESRFCFEELQSNVYWDDDQNIIENLKRDFDIVRGRDENHNRNCPQDHELEMTNSFLNVVTGISKILGQEGLTTRDLPKVLDELESALIHMMRKNFDEKRGVDFSESVHLKSLLVSIQSFKIKNVYALSLDSLRNLRWCDESELNHYVKLIESLQSTYLHFRAIQPDRLQSYVEIVHETAKIFTSEMKLPFQKRKMQALTANCISCLEFVKSDAFDPVESLDFKRFHSKARALKFNVLLFKILKVQNCKLGENQPRDCAERGPQVVRLRLKRVCNCDRQGFQLVEFLYQIKRTNAVEIRSMLVRHDYKSSQSRSQERKLTGLLVYVNCSTAVEAEKLLQLLFAWGEQKEVRDLVFQRYPLLCKKQTDCLTPEEDRARSEDRQQIIRKSDSIPRQKDFYDSERNLLRHELAAAIIDDESKRRSLCEVNLSESRWLPDNLACQKAMYHFDFARRKVDPTAETSI
jgi:hypothetical protein